MLCCGNFDHPIRRALSIFFLTSLSDFAILPTTTPLQNGDALNRNNGLSLGHSERGVARESISPTLPYLLAGMVIEEAGT